MFDEESREVLKPEQPFLTSSYRLGQYDVINGQLLHTGKFPSEAIDQWENDNQSIFGGTSWGAWQALYFRGRSLTFGRGGEDRPVDVVISHDRNQDGETFDDPIISRRHFQLDPPEDGSIQLTDLCSVNGVTIYRDNQVFKIV